MSTVMTIAPRLTLLSPFDGSGSDDLYTESSNLRFSPFPDLWEMDRTVAQLGNHGLIYDPMDIEYDTGRQPSRDPTMTTPLPSFEDPTFSTMGEATVSDSSRSPVGGSSGSSKRQHNNYNAPSAQRPSGEHCGVGSAVGSSVSPAETIFTPSSTQFTNASFRGDPNEDIEEDGVDPVLYPSISPSPTDYTGDESFEFIAAVNSRTGSNSAAMSANKHPPHSNNGSGQSRASSTVAPASSTATTLLVGQWGPVAPTAFGRANAHAVNFSHSDPFTNMAGNYTTLHHNDYPTPDQFNVALLSDAGPFDNVAAMNFNPSLSFRAMDDYASTEHFYRMGQYQQNYHQTSQQQQQQQQLQFQSRQQFALQQQQYQAQFLAAQQQFGRMHNLPPSINVDPPRTDTSFHQQRPGVRTAPPVIEQPGITNLALQSSSNMFRRPPPIDDDSSEAPPTKQRSRHSPAQASRQARSENDSPQSSQSSATSRRVKKPYPVIIKAEPGLGPNDAFQQSLQAGRRGGRKRFSRLDEDARQKSHRMRKVAACWRCALQRDPCDEGSPCNRCEMRAQKGQTYYFDCDRSKLPDFVSDFLPPTMTLMHQKQTIEDTVRDQVLEWDSQHGFDVYLTSGYGPPLRWKVHEFRPKSDELLGQLQYFQDPKTGVSQGWHKYSPPFGLMKLDQSDDTHFENYLEELMKEDYLVDLGWTCYEEETQVDPDAFQANLLDFMCRLYKDTEDEKLQYILHAIIRMMIITYIMGHTLTIVEETLRSVLTNVKLSKRPTQIMRHTSPRLANRQLKFFFSTLRNNTYKEILRWQQQTLHTSGTKEATWLTSFCAMLGFAMVLEEVQRTLQIQADAKVEKKEMAPELAYAEAVNACERIDARFKLLVGLFQCKYRDKKWGDNGSFGPGTPQLRGLAETRFLSSLRMLVKEKTVHLDDRQKIECTPENQCRYTSRLVARFLLPFLGLPS